MFNVLDNTPEILFTTIPSKAIFPRPWLWEVDSGPNRLNTIKKATCLLSSFSSFWIWLNTLSPSRSFFKGLFGGNSIWNLIVGDMRSPVRFASTRISPRYFFTFSFMSAPPERLLRPRSLNRTFSARYSASILMVALDGKLRRRAGCC